MSKKITDDVIEYVGILAKLELDEKEKKKAAIEMEKLLDYIDVLNTLDTQGVEPLSHLFTGENVFREDVVVNEDGSQEVLQNAPEVKEGMFKVPKTIG